MKVYDSQGRLKVVGFTGPAGPPGTQSVTSTELSNVQSVLAAAIDVVSNGLSNLTSIHDVLSNRVSANSATGGGGSVTSAEVQVASAAATSADAHANTVSTRVVSVSAELASLVQIASAAATSADAHANTASAAATSADGHANTASAAATSADAHANTVSARVVSVSAELASLVQIASAAAASVDGRVTSANAALSALSAKSVGNVSTHGLQSIINALSNRISAVTGGTGSVTSTELSAVSAQALSAHRNLLRVEEVTSVSGPTSVADGTYHIRAATSAGDQLVSIPLAAGFLGRRILVTKVKGGANVHVVATPTDIFNGATSAASVTLTNLWDNVLLIGNGVDAWDVMFEKAALVGGSGAGSVTSAELQTVSAQAASAKNVVSARVVSVSAELASLVQIASAAATSADAHANTVSAAANTISARVVSVSAELASLVQIASAAATSADAHANTASAAATSADAHANTVSARAVSISAELASLVQIASAAATSVNARVTSVNAALSALSGRSAGNVSTHGLQSIIDALSNRISGVTGGTGSVTSNELSAAAVSVFRSLAILRLTNEDGADASAGAPVFLATSAASAFHLATGTTNDAKEAIGLATQLITAGSSGDVQTNGILTLTTAQWDDITGQVGGLTIGSKYYVGVGNLTVTPPDPVIGFVRPIGFAIATDKMLVMPGLIDDWVPFISAVSARGFGDASTHGLQSVIDALSNRISAFSATSAEVETRVQVASAAATSANAHAAAASAAAIANDASVSAAIMADVASHLASASALIKTDINSVSAAIMADAASHLASASAAIRADEASHIASTSATIKADINSVSAAIMADAASHLASTSVAIKADVTSVSAVIKADITSVSAVIKTDINSVSAAIINEASIQYGRGQFRRITTGAQAIATATFTKVSGLSLSIEGSGFYEVHGQLVWSQSGAGSASAIFNFGMSMTAQPTMAMFRMMGNLNPLGASAAFFSVTAAVSIPTAIQFGGNSAICATPSIMYSAKPQPGVSGSVTNTMFFDGVLAASTAQSQLKVVVACSTAAFGVAIQPGSYIRAFKIG
jgi:hypothetical protein